MPYNGFDVAEIRQLMKQAESLQNESREMNNRLTQAMRPQVVGPASQVIQKIAGSKIGQDEGGFKNFNCFLKDVHTSFTKGKTTQAMDRWIKTAPSGMGETVSTDGGFLVPPSYANTLLQRAYNNDLLSRTTMFPMSSNQLKIPAVNEVSRVDGSRFGGIQAYWRAEAGTVTETKPKMAQVTLSLDSLFLLVRGTDELLEDSGLALQTYIDNLASQELTFKIGDAIINGDGTDKPLGILNAPALLTIAALAGQATKTIVIENIVQMYARMYAPCRTNAVWLINQDVEPQLLTLAQTVGVGGLPVYLPPGGLSVAPYGTLLGRPVLPIEFCATLGTAGDIILADLSTYLTGTKGSMQSAVSMHVYFTTAEQSFRFIFRLDGKPWWLKPLTPYKGTNTQSCFVALASR